MDLSKFDLKANAERGIDVSIVNPIDGSKTDIIVSVVGSDSARYRNAQIAAMVEVPLDDDMPTQKKAGVVRERNSIVMASCVTGWEGIEIDGEVLKYSPKSAVDMLSRYDWIADQLGEKIKDRENFS